MNIRLPQPPRISLNTPPGSVPLTMDMQKFFELSFWIAEELLDLEATFADWQTERSRAGQTGTFAITDGTATGGAATGSLI